MLFPPLTGIEMRSTRVEGALIIAQMKLSINLTAPTIEQVVSKMRTSHVMLIDLLLGKFRAAHAPKRALLRLEGLRLQAEKRRPEWFNSAANYREATNEALDAQVAAMDMLANPSTWYAGVNVRRSSSRRSSSSATCRTHKRFWYADLLHASEAIVPDVGGTSDGQGLSVHACLLRCAELCADSGETDLAAELLLVAAAEATRAAQVASVPSGGPHETDVAAVTAVGWNPDGNSSAPECARVRPIAPDYAR